jgi:hypothetical protein
MYCNPEMNLLEIFNHESFVKTLCLYFSIFEITILSRVCFKLWRLIYYNENIGNTIASNFKKELTSFDILVNLKRIRWKMTLDEIYSKKVVQRITVQELDSQIFPSGEFVTWTNQQKEFIKFFSLSALHKPPIWRQRLIICTVSRVFSGITNTSIQQCHNMMMQNHALRFNAPDILNIKGEVTKECKKFKETVLKVPTIILIKDL